MVFNGDIFESEYKDCNTDYMGKGFDQVQYVLDLLKNDPFSRRIFLSAWNSVNLDKTCLPPCHVSIQFCRRTIIINIYLVICINVPLIGF